MQLFVCAVCSFPFLPCYSLFLDQQLTGIYLWDEFTMFTNLIRFVILGINISVNALRLHLSDLVDFGEIN
jgi:hypothetical protein